MNANPFDFAGPAPTPRYPRASRRPLSRGGSPNLMPWALLALALAGGAAAWYFGAARHDPERESNPLSHGNRPGVEAPRSDKAPRASSDSGTPISGARKRMSEGRIRVPVKIARRVAPHPGPAADPGRVRLAAAEASLAWYRDYLAEKYPEEPLPRPPLMTDAEYKIALAAAEGFKQLNGPAGTRLVFGPSGDNASVLMPRTVRLMKREMLLQELRGPAGAAGLDRAVAVMPYLRPLLDPEYRALLLERAPLQERQRLYAEFARLTGDDRPWSLTHPFDDLPRRRMLAAIAAARKASDAGLLAMTPDEWGDLLDAGALDFFSRKLDEAHRD